MNKPSRRDKLTAQSLIVSEAEEAVGLLKSAIETLWKLRPKMPDTGYVWVSNSDLPTSLFLIATNFGILSTLLFDNGPRRAKEMAETYQLRRNRSYLINVYLVNINIKIFLNRKLRDRLIYVDEYVLTSVTETQGKTISNIGLSKRQAVNLDSCTALRVYIFEEDVFLHLGQELPIRDLYYTLLLIIPRLEKLHNDLVVSANED